MGTQERTFKALAAALAAGAMLLVGPAGLAFGDDTGGSDTPADGGDDAGTPDTHPVNPAVRALTALAPRSSLQQASTARLRTDLREVHTVTMNQFGNMAEADIHSVMIVVLKQAADDAREDMRTALEGVRYRNRDNPPDPCPGCDP